MKKALKDILYGTSTFEYETLLKLDTRDRIIALIGQVCLYIIYILLFHLAFLPYYKDTPSAHNMIFLIYALLFIGIQGPSIMTIISPSLFKYKRILKSTSLIITAIGAGLLGLQIAAITLSARGELDSKGPVLDLISQNPIFDSTPSAAALSTLGIAYFVFLIGIKLSTDAINSINEQKIGIESEVSAARKIQESINSKISVDENRFEAIGIVIPAKEVGGDYMELIKMNDSTCVLGMGDVSGHDIAAGLLMGMTKAAFDTELKYESDPEKQLSSLNNAVYNFSSEGKFVTFLTAHFDFGSNKVVTCNAGHLPLLYYRSSSQEVLELKPRGVLLGVVEDAEYWSFSQSFSKGDVFVGITDGLVELLNKEEKEFGFERIKELVLAHASLDAIEIFKQISDDYKQFASKDGIKDDISIFILKIK